MPVSFQYLRVSDGQPENLSVIDEKMCEALGVEVDPKHYCWFFDCMLYIGIGIAQEGDGFTTSKEAFEKFKEKKQASWTEDQWKLIERFAVTDYHYTAWR